MVNIAIVMRGIPGSGKSHRAKELMIKHGGTNPNIHIFSTDNYWIPMSFAMRQEGINISDEDELAEYKDNFDITKIGIAHEKNLENFQAAIDNGISPAIVDNTNVKAKEYQPYVEYAIKAGYEVAIEEPTSPWWKEFSPFLRNKSNKDKLEEFSYILFGKNKHGVPLQVIQNMIRKWEI